MQILSNYLRHQFNRCLRQGIFPPAWKEANLVLLPKEGKPRDTPAAYRPICLLDEVEILFELVLVSRFIRYLHEVGPPQLHDQQYGFRRGCSMSDAVMSVRVHAGSVVEEDGMLMAASLDVSNAFNTLPREAIRGRWPVAASPRTSNGWCGPTSVIGDWPTGTRTA